MFVCLFKTAVKGQRDAEMLRSTGDAQLVIARLSLAR